MKNKILKASVAMGLAVAMMACLATPFSAEVVETQTMEENGSAECVVTYTLDSADSTWIVTIPKTIELDETKTADYDVTVTGDIASNSQITVVPQDAVDTEEGINFYMKDQSGAATLKDDVLATVTQAETVWTWDEMASEDAAEYTKTGNVSATGLTAGTWSGSFNFEIALENIQ